MPDLKRIVADLAYLAELVGQPLAPWQRPRLDRLFCVLLAARQLGKSRLLALIALWRAVREPEHTVLIASASEDGSRRLLALARSYAAAYPPLAASFEAEHLGVLTLSNGSTIRAIATSEVAARGWSAGTLLLDEAQLLSRTFIDSITPTVAARPGALVVMAGTASVASGGFFDYARQGEVGSEHVEYHRWVSTLAGGQCPTPWISPTVIEAARERMSASRFGAEFQAEWASGADTVFPLALLERATADFAAETSSLANLRPFARGSGGFDFGERSDHCALVRVDRFAGTNTFGISTARRWPSGEPIPSVIDEVVNSPGHFAAILPERNGLGGPSAQFLEKQFRTRSPRAGGGRRAPAFVSFTAEEEERLIRRANEQKKHARLGDTATRSANFHTQVAQIFTTASMKAIGFGLARLMFEQGQLLIPAAAVDLRTELTFLRSELREGGVERIEAATGHDDLAMAMLLALQPVRVRERGGESWRLRLADLANPRRPVPPTAGPLVDGETVQTGAGVDVPRDPTWQSIAGPELTLPAGAAPADPRTYAPPLSPQVRRARELLAANNQEED